MPIYDYLCADCGPFTAMRPMAEFQQPQPCEQCGEAAPRALLTAPALSGMDAGRRRAGDGQRTQRECTDAGEAPSGVLRLLFRARPRAS